MGTYSKSNFGKIKGKVGEAVGSKWRGISVLRSLPTKSGKPATEAQLAVQGKIALAAALLSPIKKVLNLGFSDKKLNKLSGYNAAVKAFLTDAVTGTYPNLVIDYSKIVMSKGPLNPEDVVLSTSTEIALSWVPEFSEENSFFDDKMLFIIYNETRKTYRFNNSFTRMDAGISIPFSGRLNDVLHIWSYCIHRDGKTVSSSVYVGTLTVLAA